MCFCQFSLKAALLSQSLCSALMDTAVSVLLSGGKGQLGFMKHAHPAAHKAADTLLIASHGLMLLLAAPRACHHTPAAGVAGACS